MIRPPPRSTLFPSPPLSRSDELPTDTTKPPPASFEPVLDYVVVKVPRFAFEKFPTADYRLTTQMKSVGEAMAIGRTFKEAFQKGLRALEAGRPGWAIGPTLADDRLTSDSLADLRVALRTPTPERVFQIDRKSTRLNSSHLVISYAVFCLKKKKNTQHNTSPTRLPEINT